MNKRLLSVLIIIILLTTFMVGCSGTDKPADPASSEPEGEPIVLEYEQYGEYGKVLKCIPSEGKVYIEAEGYYGYHMEDNPSMTVGVTISEDGTILEVVNIASKDQTEGFAEMITDDYLSKAYSGLASSPNLEVDSVSGATITSKAIMYAVQTAAYYAENVFDYVADTSSEEIEELKAVFPANYTPVSSNYVVDERNIGTVLFAAEGKADDGKEVLALKVRSANKMNYEKTARTGWDSSEPNPFTMIIVIDKSTNAVTAWEMITDGTKNPEYFTVPEDKINTYMNVEITSEDVFDDFIEGLVFDLDVEKETDSDGYSIIAGTSIVYTGTSVAGTFSSQHVRQCFKTAAYFYSNYK